MTNRAPWRVAIAFIVVTPPLADANRTELVELSEGTNLTLSLSPDGNTLAIDLLGQLWLMPAGGGAAQPLTPTDEEARAPRFDPSGETIVYQGYAGGSWDIWSVNLATGDRHQLTQDRYDDREPDVHPRGTHVAFASDRSGRSQIWELSLADGELTQLTWDARPSAYPSYSPDGSRIAYVTGTAQRSELKVQDRASRATLSVYATTGQLFAPSWRPGGGVLTAGLRQGLATELHMLLLGPDGLSKRLTSTQEDVFPSRTAWLNADEFLYAADGRIWRRHLDPFGRKPVPLFAAVSVTQPVYQRKRRDLEAATPRSVLGIRSPRVNAAGDKVVFTALGDLWLLDRKGRTTQLTDDPYVDIDPVFYDDDSRVLFGSDRAGSMQLWSMSLKDKQAEPLTALGGATYFPALSPDGERVAFLQTRGRNVWGPVSLQILSLKDGAVTTLAPTLFSPGRPSWLSPRRLIIPTLATLSNRFREGSNKIVQFDTDSSQQQIFPFADAIAVGTRINHGPEANPNGTQVAAATAAGIQLYDLVPRTSAPPAVPGIGSVAPSFDKQGELTYLDADGLKRLDLDTGKRTSWPFALQWKAPARDAEYVIQAGRVFDGIGTGYRRHMDIHIRGQRIVAVVPRDSLPYPDTVVDARDLTVLPGLVDMHVHQSAVWGEKLGRLWLAFGVTSIREPGADPYDALERRESWDSGKRLGPRLFFAGELLDGDRVYYGQSAPVPTAALVDAAVERAGRLDYDWLKTYVRLPHRLQQRVIARAHALGIPVSSHEVFPAAWFGADGVEHLGATSRRSFNPKVSMGNRTYGDVLDILAASKMAFTPTIALLGGMAELSNRDSRFLLDPTYRSFYPAENQRAVNAVLGFWRHRQDLAQYNEALGTTVARMTQRGARVVAGTDAPFIPYGLGLHAELITLGKAGIPSDQVLRMATSEAALALGYSQDLGSVEAGRLADLVVVNGDPLADLDQLRTRITAVVKGGLWLDRQTLVGPVEQVYARGKN